MRHNNEKKMSYASQQKKEDVLCVMTMKRKCLMRHNKERIGLFTASQQRKRKRLLAIKDDCDYYIIILSGV